jgi:hypothetical protein
MKKIFGSIGVSMLLIVFTCFGVLFAQEIKAPKIEIQDLQHTVGNVTQGTNASHVFTFRNTGNEPLIIEKVNASCGCTATVVSASRLDPGINGQIKVTVDTSGLSGHLVRYVSVYSNDRTNPVITLSMVMDVIQK